MIYGERIRLRGVERADLPRFVAWLNDPEVKENLLMQTPLSQAMEDSWFESMLKRPVEEHPLIIEVRQAGDGVDGEADGGDADWLPIGNCSINDIHWSIRSAEVGIFIGEKALWNQGYGTQAMRLLLRHGFETLNLNRIFLRVFETNLRAVRSYEKAGFILEGRQRQAMYKDGRYIDVLVMSILRSEWEEAGPPSHQG
jgi:RimJ/RimL family protein N-acetyltransferase